MGLYIKGIELPKEPDEMIELAIFGDGKTLKTGESWRSPVDGKCYYGTSEDMNTYSAFAVSPHGRLIDADELQKDFNALLPFKENNDITEDYVDGIMVGCDTLQNAPTVIEAEDGA